MKKLLGILLSFIALVAFQDVSFAQFAKLKQKVQDKVAQRVDQKTDKAIDNTLDSADAATKANKNKPKSGGGTSANAQTQSNDNGAQAGAATAVSQAQPSVKAYQNYERDKANSINSVVKKPFFSRKAIT